MGRNLRGIRKITAKIILLCFVLFCVVSICTINMRHNIENTSELGTVTEISSNEIVPLPSIEENTIEISEMESVNLTEKQYITVWTNCRANIRPEPSTKSDVITTLHYATEIQVYKYNEEWLEVSYMDVSGYIFAELVTETKPTYIEYNTPYNPIKTFMSYKNITSKVSNQYKLQQIACAGNYGIRQVNGRYCIAVGSAYTTQIGTYIDLVLENGEIIPCILADCKADIHTDPLNILGLDGSLAEFVVDKNQLSNTVKYTGDISTACDEWKSTITKIKIYEKMEEY